MNVLSNSSNESKEFFKNLQNMGTNLENLNINIRKSPRKCRFFNRGYCKYQDNCSYFHSNTICESYLKNGICDEKACLSRHPRQCRYWSTRAEGCQRENRCQYLRFTSPQIGLLQLR